MRGSVVHLFLVGCIALVCAGAVYPPVDRTNLSWWGLFGFVAAAAFLWQRREDGTTAVRVLVALLPWLLGSAVLANGALDRSIERRYETVVIETRYSYRSGLFDTLIVRSWRPGRPSESLSVKTYQPFFYSGDRVAIGVRDGALGLPWISSVSR